MPITRSLTQLSKGQVQDFLNSFDIVLSDCDGVIWYLERPISGAIGAVKRLQELGKKLYLVTNNSTIAVDRYREKLRLEGLHVTSEQIINAAKVVTWYLKKIQFTGEAFVIASSTFRQVLIDGGIKLSPEDPKIDEGNAVATIKAVQDRPSVKAIIVDFCLFFDWAKLAFAISCLNRNDVIYLCGAHDEWVVYGIDKKILGPGPLIEVITKQSGRRSIECAKPSEALKSYIWEKCKVKDPKRCLLIGDTMNYDMKFGTMCGFQKLLVETGLDRVKDAELNEETRPDYYLPSLALLSPIIDSLCNDTESKENGC